MLLTPSPWLSDSQSRKETMVSRVGTHGFVGPDGHHVFACWGDSAATTISTLTLGPSGQEETQGWPEARRASLGGPESGRDRSSSTAFCLVASQEQRPVLWSLWWEETSRKHPGGRTSGALMDEGPRTPTDASPGL